MKSLVWASSAAADLREIVDWLSAKATPTAAMSFVDRIDEALSQLPMHPESGRVIPELERQNITKYREIIVTPWRVLYTVREDSVVLLAVIDGRRDVEDLLLRRNLR
mgnify:FL=1